MIKKTHQKNCETMLTIIEPKTYQDYRPVLCPLYSANVSAGFPSPADDYIEGQLDLNEHFIKRPAATFFVRVSGDSMINAGIHEHDILIVDRSIEAKHDHIVIAVIDSELTVKRLVRRGSGYELHPENKSYPIMKFKAGETLQIWGVVTGVTRKF